MGKGYVEARRMQVAASAGFESLLYFSRLLKRWMGDAAAVSAADAGELSIHWLSPGFRISGCAPAFAGVTIECGTGAAR